MATQDRREQERARRRQEILEAARAVFAQDGFRRATVDQIAQHAEVAKGTIYLYFETKEAILADLVLQALAELQAQLRAAVEAQSILQPDERLRAMADAYLTFSQRSPDYFRLLTAFDGGDLASDLSAQRNGLILEASNRTLDLVAQAVADGMALGIFAVHDARQAAAVLWAGLNGSLALLSHPIRRTLVATDLPGLYHATLELLLKGLTCADLALPEPDAAGSNTAAARASTFETTDQPDKEKMA
jgi:AcrR family transcriptional regulator